MAEAPKNKPWFKSLTLWTNGIAAIVAFLHEWLPLVDELLPVLQDERQMTSALGLVAIGNIILRFKTKQKVGK